MFMVNPCKTPHLHPFSLLKSRFFPWRKSAVSPRSVAERNQEAADEQSQARAVLRPFASGERGAQGSEDGPERSMVIL